MQRIETVTGLFNAGNPATNTKGTVVTADWLNGVQEEIAFAIEAAGDTLNPATSAQLARVIQSGKLAAATAAGTPDAITASFMPPITALTSGMELRVRAAAANTSAAPTFTPGGPILARTIVKTDNQPLAEGDIAGAGHWLTLQYDAPLDKWALLNPAQSDRQDDGIPLLMTIWSAIGIPEPGYLDISQDNGLLARSAFPEAWAKIQAAIAAGSTAVISESAWQNEKTANGGVCGKFSTGDGSTTFRVPLIAKRFVRATGPGLSVGTAQGDAIRNITGAFGAGGSSFGSVIANISGVFASNTLSGSTDITAYQTGTHGGADFNASLVVPTADENRPVSVAQTPMLKMYGAPIDTGQIDLAALVQSLAAKLDTSVFEAWKDDTDDLRAFAWVTFDGNGQITKSRNVASVTRQATGVFLVTFIKPATSDNYGGSAISTRGASSNNVVCFNLSSNGVTSCVLNTYGATGNNLNPPGTSLVHIRFYQ